MVWEGKWKLHKCSRDCFKAPGVKGKVLGSCVRKVGVRDEYTDALQSESCEVC